MIRGTAFFLQWTKNLFFLCENQFSETESKCTKQFRGSRFFLKINEVVN